MMQSFKYGLTATVGYMVLLTVLLALTAWIEGNGMSYIYYDLISPFNAVLSAICGIIVFFTRYCFPRIFSHMVEDYKSEYPDIPEKYVIQICRGKVLLKYRNRLFSCKSVYMYRETSSDYRLVSCCNRNTVLDSIHTI